MLNRMTRSDVDAEDKLFTDLDPTLDACASPRSARSS